MSASENLNRRLLRARDAMDRRYAEPLSVPALARVALMSPAHFSRSFARLFGETPHRYLQRRRIERAMTLLRQGDRPVTEIAFAVGSSSLGTFGRTFSAVVGSSPTQFRSTHGIVPVPSCLIAASTRPAERRPA